MKKTPRRDDIEKLESTIASLPFGDARTHLLEHKLRFLRYMEVDNVLDKDSIFELQKVDANCNNCISFLRDIEKTQRLNTNTHIKQNKVHYGTCSKFCKDVGEIANITLLHTQKCFTHRK